VDATHGYVRRWLVVEMPNRFDPEDREDGLSETMASEAEGVIVKAVGALRRIMDRGHFTETEATASAHEEMVAHINPVQTFLDDMLVASVGASVERRRVYAIYSAWCDENGVGALSARRFTPRLRAALLSAGIAYDEEKRSDGVRVWKGLAFRPVPR
jgi:phage/plasmid-associated DNA primase